MGYFSNSTEGMAYEARYCNRCEHQRADHGGCAVWLAHMIYNYDSRDRVDVLNLLIPRGPHGNEQCAMYLGPSVDLVVDDRQGMLF